MKKIPEDILASVEKPARYIGGEVNAISKDRGRCKCSIVLAFPDAYEVGMSHLGLQILYAVLNREPELAAERVYAPWPDLERHMRRGNIDLSSLESGTPLSDFDIVGFSLQYELSFTNVLTMLDLGGIPLRRSDRRDGDPIVIAGGPCVFNPAPMDRFIDAFVIGEGEEAIVDIARAVATAKAKNRKRQDILHDLAAIEGVFVPSVHPSGERVRKRIVMDLDACAVPLNPLAPLMKTVHDRVTLEIARGCTRGCRFCQAGMVWRPTRERSPGCLQTMADAMLAATGQDELSLLSLSSGDYSLIEPLLSSFMDRYYDRRIALALPSLRVETLTQRLIEDIRRVRKTSFTLAPEAGTQRLRNVINKGNTEEDLLDTVQRVFDAGWRSVKLYFMIGLPTETQDDMEGIARLAYRVLGKTKKREQVTVSLSTFVPKAHTPFQWERQIDLDQTAEKQDYLKSHLRHRNIEVRWHDPQVSLLEGLFARGDEALGALIERAYRLGCRFDGWTDHFRYELWEEAMDAENIHPASYLRSRDRSETLPWDRIDCGVSKTFLAEEADRSRQEELSPDCRIDGCRECGVCDHKDVLIKIADHDSGLSAMAHTDEQAPEKVPAKEDRYRMTFTKRGAMRFLAHMDISTTLQRAMGRAGLAFVFSGGFHPHPKISYAFATPVGMESAAEYADLHIEATQEDEADLMARVNAYLPEGLKIISLSKIWTGEPSLHEVIEAFSFSVFLPQSLDAADLDGLSGKISDFLAATTFTIDRTTKGKETKKEIRSFVEALDLNPADRRLAMKLRFSTLGTVRPVDILTQVLGFAHAEAVAMKTLKQETHFKP